MKSFNSRHSSKRLLRTLAAAATLAPLAAALLLPPALRAQDAAGTATGAAPTGAESAPVPASAAGADSSAAPADSAAAPADDTVRLDTVAVEGADVGTTVLPVRPNAAFYGFEELVQNTPRSIFQVSPIQLKTDHFQNFSDLARYSPSVGRGTSSNFSTFAKIRGGPADTTRDGILLLPAAVRPFNNNYWESVDIVAGVPSVIQGSTSRTAGVVNYVTKKPLFDGDHLTASIEAGRLGKHSDTTYRQTTEQFDYNHVLIPNELAARVSFQKTDAKQYWGNSASEYYDIYGAVTYKPLSKVTINTNFTYTDAGGPMPYGINRVDQTLIDKWQYRAYNVIPRISWTLPGNATASTLYASRENPGWFSTSITGSYDIDGSTLGFTKGNPVAVSYATPTTLGTAQNGGLDANGRPKEGYYSLVPIRGDQIIYTDQSFSQTTEMIAQNVIEIRANENFTFRNNTLWHYVDSYVNGNDGYHSYMINKMITSRIEILTDHDLGFLASWLKKIGARHQSNTGYEFRYLWNFCDMVTGGNQNGNNQDASNSADGNGKLGRYTLLQTPNVYAGDVYLDGNTPRQRIQTGYGFWTYGNPNFYKGAGRYDGLATSDLMLRVNQLYQNNLFTEQKLEIWKFTLRGGARITFINDFIEPNRTTENAVKNGLLPGYTQAHWRDHQSGNNYDINGSIAFQPVSWLTTYAAWDKDTASGDCACCLTMGYSVAPDINGSNPGNRQHVINRAAFKLKSSLREFGAKAEIIPGKLFGSVAYFHQTRANMIAPSATYPDGGITAGDTYEGYEIALTYQPNNHFSAGFNYSHLDATTANGLVKSGSPKHNANFWTNYHFDNGFGLKASLWLTSEWNVTNTVKVPIQYNVDLGAYYVHKRWRVEVNLLNATDQKNWSPSGNYAGDTYGYLLPTERIGLTTKVTYSW